MREGHQLPELCEQRLGIRGGKRKDLSADTKLARVSVARGGWAPSESAYAHLFADLQGAIHKRYVVDEAARKQRVCFIKDLQARHAKQTRYRSVLRTRSRR